MANYRARLDRIEAVLRKSPRNGRASFVWVDEDMTLEGAATNYALDHGLGSEAISRVLARRISASWLRSSESAEGDAANHGHTPRYRAIYTREGVYAVRRAHRAAARPCAVARRTRTIPSAAIPAPLHHLVRAASPRAILRKRCRTKPVAKRSR
jgi:hypothetical protein